MDRERAQAFAADGLVVVPGAIPPAVVAAQRAALAEALAVDGVDLDDAATWRAGGGLPWIELAGALRPAPTAALRMWQVSPPAVHDALLAGFAAALDAVFGAAQWAAQPGVQAMPNLPLPGPPWTPPHQAWHVDEPIAPGGVGPWGLLGFVASRRSRPPVARPWRSPARTAARRPRRRGRAASSSRPRRWPRSPRAPPATPWSRRRPARSRAAGPIAGRPGALRADAATPAI
jgi:hypothetical protein